MRSPKNSITKHVVGFGGILPFKSSVSPTTPNRHWNPSAFSASGCPRNEPWPPKGMAVIIEGVSLTEPVKKHCSPHVHDLLFFWRWHKTCQKWLKEERITTIQDWEVQGAGRSWCRSVTELIFMGPWSGSREGGALLRLSLSPVYTFWLTGWDYQHSGCLWWLERDPRIPGILCWWHILGWFGSSGLSKRKCVTRAEQDSLRTEAFEACSPWFLFAAKDVNCQFLLQTPETSTPPSLASIPLRG